MMPPLRRARLRKGESHNIDPSYAARAMTSAIDPQRWAEAMASFEARAEVAEAERPAWLEALVAPRPEPHALLIAPIRADSAAEHSAFPPASGAPRAGVRHSKVETP